MSEPSGTPGVDQGTDEHHDVHAQRRVLAGQDHGPAPEVIVPELARFLRRPRNRISARSGRMAAQPLLGTAPRRPRQPRVLDDLPQLR